MDLKTQLFERLNRNLADYHTQLTGFDRQTIISMAGRISAVADAHFYLTNHHEFAASEIEYLLNFKNPLEVVADEWQRRTEDLSDMSFVLHEVFDRQDALQSYPLMDNTDSGTRQRLIDRLDQNVTDMLLHYREALANPNADFQELAKIAEHVVTITAAHDFLKHDYNFQPGETEYLLQFKNPLELVADSWPGTLDGLIGMDDVMIDILDDREAHKRYSRIEDSHAENEAFRKPSAVGKPSIRAMLREAAKEAQAHSTPDIQKSHADRDAR